MHNSDVCRFHSILTLRCFFRVIILGAVCLGCRRSWHIFRSIPEHRAQMIPLHQKSGQCPKGHIGTVELQRSKGVKVFVKRPRRYDCPEGSSSTDNSRDNRQFSGNHVRHNAIRCTLRHVYEDSEDYECDKCEWPTSTVFRDASEKK